ncbi:MAG: hypothetical protein LBM25_05525 [Bacteroidales bacterium]|jgi:hypothetical protein|nr:hypothetical protein [Bacteroidales bacterium]
MEKIIFLISLVAILVSCSTTKNRNLVNEKDVPARYVNDFKKNRPNAQKSSWEKVDSLSYKAIFTDNNNQMQILYSKTGTQTSWIVPLQYVPSAITDYITKNYPSYKLQEVSISDVKNKKVYNAVIKLNKKEVKTLEFDLNGEFKSEVR